MSKKNKIDLEFKCSQKIEDLESSDRGLNCAECKKSIKDFRENSVEEIHEFISNSSAKVCGIFKKSQLTNNFLKYAATSMLITGNALTAKSQESTSNDSIITQCELTEEIEEEILLGYVMEAMPEPIGGIKEFYDEIGKNLKYPKGLIENGKVFVEFEVDTAGKMINFKVVKGYDAKADSAAMEVLKNLDYSFSPAKQRGKPVKAKMVIPIFFKPE